MTASFAPITAVAASESADVSAAPTSTRRMWAVGVGAGAVSSLLAIGVAAIADGAGVPMLVAESETARAEQIPLLGYGTVIMASTLVGLLLATAFARWTRRPRRTFVIAALVLTAFSCLFPATTTATTATKVVLEITHLIPAALVIPALASHLATHRSRRIAA